MNRFLSRGSATTDSIGKVWIVTLLTYGHDLEIVAVCADAEVAERWIEAELRRLDAEEQRTGHVLKNGLEYEAHPWVVFT
jgi:hypothetical protein